MSLIKKSLNSLLIRPDGHNPAVDGIRALAIILVGIGHVYTIQVALTEVPKPSWLRHDYGVDMFFVISGFLIGTILIKEFQKTNKINYAKFYVRRFLRLMPVYVVILIAGIYFMQNWYNQLPDQGLPLLGDNTLIGEGTNAKNMWANLFYVNNFLDADEQYLLWCWSLAIEEQFYIIAPFFLSFILLKTRKRISIFIALLILSCIIRFVTVYQHNIFPENYWNALSTGPNGKNYLNYTFTHLYDNLLTRYGGLLVGVIGAYLVQFHLNKIRVFMAKKLASIILIFSVVIFFGAFVDLEFRYFGRFAEFSQLTLNDWEKVYWAATIGFSRNLFSLATMFIILYSIYNKTSIGRGINKFLSLRWFYPVAQISYSAYLTHWMLMFWMYPSTVPFLSEYFESIHVVHAINGILGVIATLLASIILYIFIERPLMDCRNSKKINGLITRLSRKTSQST